MIQSRKGKFVMTPLTYLSNMFKVLESDSRGIVGITWSNEGEKGGSYLLLCVDFHICVIMWITFTVRKTSSLYPFHPFSSLPLSLSLPPSLPSLLSFSPPSFSFSLSSLFLFFSGGGVLAWLKLASSEVRKLSWENNFIKLACHQNTWFVLVSSEH